MGTGGGNVPMVMEPYTSSKASYHQKFTNDGKTETLLASDYKDPQCVVYANEAYDKWNESEKGATLKASGGIYNGGSENLSVNYTVRRLTPLECERLQGFPDNWTNIGEWIDSKGKKHKDADSPRYKALGNSIALPFWQWMADRMVKVLKEEGVQLPTMASLFDGIGGFPLVYSRCGCKPIWASEIEEFPMAVTKIRFPEVDYESSNHNKRE
jgi:DNA (cytosine-5)-methyltransferase 1